MKSINKISLMMVLMIFTFAIGCKDEQESLLDGDLDNSESFEDVDALENENIVSDGDSEITGENEAFEENETDQIDNNYPDGSETKNSLQLTEYIIICDEDTVTAFEPLMEWKIAKGIPTKIITTSWIYDNFDGIDDAEKVRNFLIDSYDKYPLTWVLLGGDTPAVPHREFFCSTDVFGQYYTDGTIASDLYFADLDGTWDDDKDGTWGEVEDDLDMYPEIYVTRVPVDDAEQAEIFVSKILNYEQSPPSDFIKNVLFISEDTGFYGVDASLALDPMEREYFPDRFNIRKLYWDPTIHEGAEINNYDNQYEAFAEGPNLFVHFGHGGGADVARMDLEDLNGLQNAPKSGVMVSTACNSGGFHEYTQCGGDAFVTSPNGGGVAYLGNTEVGIGFPSGMNFIYKFYENLLQAENATVKLGNLFAKARIEFTNDEDMHKFEHQDRWATLSMVVFGDPEMPIWVDEPTILDVSFDDEIATGKNVFTVKVLAKNKPLQNAVVSLYLKDEFLLNQNTNEEGLAEFHFAPDKEFDIELTVTAFQALPFTGFVKVK